MSTSAAFATTHVDRDGAEPSSNRVSNGTRPVEPKRSRYRGGARPYVEKLVSRLARSVYWSRLKLLPFREQRYRMVKAYTGKHYGDSANSVSMPVPWMEMCIDTYCQHLAANNPRYMLSTPHQDAKALALELETSVNFQTLRLDLRKDLKLCVKDALFLMTVMKLGLCPKGGDPDEDSGMPFAKRVSMDDWVHDIFGREYEECWFAGNHYIKRIDSIRENRSFDKDVREDVQPQPRTSFNEQGDPKVSTAGPGFSDLQDADLYDSAPLWDFWLPEEGREPLVCTIVADRAYAIGDTSKVLAVREWEGPECGPYETMGYFSVPDNLMPLSMASLIFDTAHGYNILFRKIMDQAARQKTILPFNGVDDDSTLRINQTPDGGAVRVDGEMPKEVSLGGPNNLVQALIVKLDQTISHLAGNIDLMMGAEAQSPTAEQDKMLMSNGNIRLGEMSDVTMDFANRIGKHLVWYTMTDENIQEKLVKDIGRGVHIPFTLDYGRMYGGKKPKLEAIRTQFLQLNFEVQAYSMQPKTPKVRLQSLQTFLQAIAPLLPMAQQQGEHIDFQGLCRLFAKYEAFDELDTLIKFVNPDTSNTQPAGPGGPAPAAPMKMQPQRPGPAPTGQAPRRGQATQAGSNMQMMQSLMGMGNGNGASAA